jgi:hypothetical protein
MRAVNKWQGKNKSQALGRASDAKWWHEVPDERTKCAKPSDSEPRSVAAAHRRRRATQPPKALLLLARGIKFGGCWDCDLL